MDGISFEEVSRAKAALEEYDRSIKSGRREPFNPAVLMKAGVTMLRWGNYLEAKLASPQIQGPNDIGSHG